MGPIQQNRSFLVATGRASNERPVISVDKVSRTYFSDVHAECAEPVWLRILEARIPKQDAEELLQDVFLSVHQVLSAYRPECGPLLPWVLHLCDAHVVDYQRDQEREHEGLALLKGAMARRNDWSRRRR